MKLGALNRYYVHNPNCSVMYTMSQALPTMHCTLISDKYLVVAFRSCFREVLQIFKLYNSLVVIIVVKLAIRMGCWVHREQFNLWFLGDIKYSWLDKMAYPIYCTIHRKPSG